ncbi:hypothetical protein B0H13DRAFT_1901785 [Mycena leptocephala]|nr:hypothetical protein B0H13DRAFT_1901785 [Mycena leptocephala]
MCNVGASEVTALSMRTEVNGNKHTWGLNYDGIYRQKLSTDYRAHVAMNIYLYLMNIYSCWRYMNLSDTHFVYLLTIQSMPIMTNPTPNPAQPNPTQPQSQAQAQAQGSFPQPPHLL